MNYFCKLLPPRPSFAQDMTPDEAALMQRHSAYWKAGIGRGQVVCFGLVADPQSAFGVGFLDVESDAEAKAFTDADPTIQSGRGFVFEVNPMPFGLIIDA